MRWSFSDSAIRCNSDSGVVPTDEVINNYDPKETIIAGIRYERSVDQIEHPIDFRVPTYAHPVEEDLDNTLGFVSQILIVKLLLEVKK